jgi:quercetin dioxygenase-like cupin family protein
MNPNIQIACVSNLFSKMMHFQKAGDMDLGHTHPFDHLTLLASGSLKLIVNDEETIFKAPHMIYIHKDKHHKLVALEDNTVAYCIHALRDGNGVDDILDPNMIPQGVDPLSIAKSIVNVI